MPSNVARLRKWFAFGALAVLALVAVLYISNRIRVARAVQEAPRNLGLEIQQSAAGFTLSKSEGGRTLFTVKASRAVQFKQGGRTQLHQVSIEVFGRDGERVDRIQGAGFNYDPASGDISAQGEVHIDIGARQGAPATAADAEHGGQDGAPGTPEFGALGGQDAIHFRTSGVVFNHKTGFAATKQGIEFRTPQASGRAVGATYDARQALLTLESSVRVTLAQEVEVVAQHGTVTREPRQALLNVVRVDRPTGTLDAERLAIILRSDNTVERLLASGGFRATSRGATPASVRAAQAEFSLASNDLLRSVLLTGGVNFEQGGAAPVHATASRAWLDFGPRNLIQKLRASGGFKLTRAGDQAAELSSDALDVGFRNGRPQQAETGGAAQVVIREQAAQGQTIATAGKFHIGFDRRGRLESLRGAPDARIVSRLPGMPDRTSTGRELNLSFADSGAVASVIQQGNVTYEDGQMKATAAKATFTPQNDMLALSGSPRVVQSGLTLTANVMRFNRRTGEASAEGEVKTTYNQLQPQPGGALLATGDPIHATAQRMTASRDAAKARYSGGARLWQGTNILQAPAIEFDRDRRTLVADGSSRQRVSTVFVQADKKGQVTPVNVTAAKFTYVDAQRKARLEGGVTVRGADASITAQRAEILLRARGEAQKSRGNSPAPASQVEEVTATGQVAIEQPSRRATGERLTYTASDGKFVLSGGSPSIFDAEHGQIAGDSLTFFSRDDRVLVGSRDSSRTVTQTRVNR